jgi:methyltransferase-like protein
MLMDGTRDHDALRRDLLKLFESGALTLLDGDKPVSDMQTVEKRIDAETENVLGGLARMAALVE